MMPCLLSLQTILVSSIVQMLFAKKLLSIKGLLYHKWSQIPMYHLLNFERGEKMTTSLSENRLSKILQKYPKKNIHNMLCAGGYFKNQFAVFPPPITFYDLLSNFNPHFSLQKVTTHPP